MINKLTNALAPTALQAVRGEMLPMLVKVRTNAVQLYRGGAERGGHVLDSKPALMPKDAKTLPKLASFRQNGVDNSLMFGRTTGTTLFNTMMKFSRQLPETMKFDLGQGVRHALAGAGFSDDRIAEIAGEAEKGAAEAMKNHGSDDPGLFNSALLAQVLKQVPADKKEDVFADVMAQVSSNLLSGREAELRTADPSDTFYAFRDSDSKFSIYYLNHDQMTALAEQAVVKDGNGGMVFDRDKVKDLLALPSGSGAAKIFVASPMAECEYIVSTLNPMKLTTPDGQETIRPGGLQQSQIRPDHLSARQEISDAEALKMLSGILDRLH